MMSTLSLYLLNIVWIAVNCKIHSSVFGNDSGSFGQWNQNNPYNLPSYIYTVDQVNDPIATIYNSSVQYQFWDNPLPSRNNITDHKFQFGNDRITVLASNYGYIQMRSDESGPKLLNDFNRKNNVYGSGIAYLTTDNQINQSLLTSTFYTGNCSDHREYSFFYRKYITNASIENAVVINQTLITPFGDDPVIISQVTLQSNTDSDSNLNYYEVYGGAMYQLLNINPSQIRQYQINNYNVSYSHQSIDDNNGILAQYQYTGQKQSIPNVKNGWFWDENPPQLFVSTIAKNNNLSVHFGCDSNTFFGLGGAEMPSFQLSDCNGFGDIKSAGIIIKIGGISLQKNIPYTFYIISGYIPNGFTFNQLIHKYNDDNILRNLLDKTAQNWYQDAIKFDTAKYPEISREILWDYGYTRSSLSFYDLYNESILDQGTWYRYINGFQGAFRDPLQHMLPLLFTTPDKVKSIIRYQLKQLQPKFNDIARYFNVPYALTANGIMFDQTVSSAPSDLEIYLLWSVSEYILATKDIDFLSEEIYLNVFDVTQNDYANYSVLDCLMESYEFLRSHIGIGQHGVVRLQTGDWSDSFLSLSGANKTLIEEQGESGLNTAMTAYTLPRFNKVLGMINKSVTEIDEFAHFQQNVLRNVLWNGLWIDRAWIPINDSADGEWLGSLQDDRMHLFPQIFTILSDVLNKTAINVLLDSIDKRLRDYPNPIGAINVNPPYPPNGNIWNGTHENGGIWPSLNHPLVIALSTLNSSMAFDEWQKNSFAHRANIYPQLWPNIWSSSDVTSSFLVEETKKSAVGTSNWPNFPILCTHSHAWPLYSLATGLVGVTFGPYSIVIQPGLPQNKEFEFGSFGFISRLVQVHRDDDGNYNGSYTPVRFIGDVFEVVVDLRVEKDAIFEKDCEEWIFRKSIKLKHQYSTIKWEFDVANKLLNVNYNTE